MIAHLVMSNNFSSFWPFIWPSYYGPGGRRGWRPPILSLSLSCWLFKNNLLDLKYSGPSLLCSSPFAPTVHRRSFLKYLSCRSFAIAQTKTPTQMTVNSLYNNVRSCGPPVIYGISVLARFHSSISLVPAPTKTRRGLIAPIALTCANLVVF